MFSSYRSSGEDGRTWRLMARVGGDSVRLWVDVLPTAMSQFDLRYGEQGVGCLERWVEEDPNEVKKVALPDDARSNPEIYMTLGEEQAFPHFPRVREGKNERHEFDAFTTDPRPLRLVRAARFLSLQALGDTVAEFSSYATRFPFLVDVSWNDAGWNKISYPEGPLYRWLNRSDGAPETTLQMITRSDWYKAAEGVGYYEVRYRGGKLTLEPLVDLKTAAESLDERVSFVRYEPEPERDAMERLVKDLNGELEGLEPLQEVFHVMAHLGFTRYSISRWGVLGLVGLFYEWLDESSTSDYEQVGSPPGDIVCPLPGEVYRANSFAYDMLFGVRYCLVDDGDSDVAARGAAVSADEE